MSKFSDATFYLSPSGYKEGFIFPQKPLSTNGDVSFVRAGSAWRTTIDGQIEESPYNLLSYSEDFNNALWSKSSVSITSNSTISPLGTLTASTLTDTAGNGFMYQAFSAITGQMYTLSLWIKSVSASTSLQLALYNAGGSSTFSSRTITTTSDWQLVTVTGISPTTQLAWATIGGNVTFSSPNSLYVWGAQLVIGSLPKNYLATTNRQNFPRIDYSLGTGNLLLEPQRTNSIRNSTMVGASVSTNTIPNNWGFQMNGVTSTIIGSGIDNGLNYIDVRLSGTATNFSQITFEQNTTIAATQNQVWTHSFYFKLTDYTILPDSLRIQVNEFTSGGTFISGGQLAFTPTTTLTRIVQTRTNVNATCAYIIPYIFFNLTSGNSYNFTFRISGNQLELGTYATTFIPTSNASATRLVDTFSRNNLYTNNLISISGGTWLIDLRNSTTYIRDIFSQSISLGYFFNAVGGNGFALTFGSTSPTGFQFRKYVGGVETTLYGSSTGTVKLLIKWNGSTADLFINGVKQISATVFTATTMSHFFATGASNPINILQTALWNTPLTDAQCIELTS